MKRLSWFVGVLILAVAGCAAVGKATPAQPAPEVSRLRNMNPKVPAADLGRLAADNNAFAFNLYRQVRSQKGNLVFSPFSISTALGMTYAGARGETEKQMAKTLHFTLPQPSLHPAFNALDLSLTSRGAKDADQYAEMVRRYGRPTPGQKRDASPAFQLRIANSLWGQQDHRFLPVFLDLLDRNYGAGLRKSDFKKNPEGARKAINAWVERETMGKIRDLIAQGVIDPMTRLVLANAIYFKNGWEHPFGQTARPGPFTLLGGKQVKADMMSQTERFQYASGQGWQAVELPYKFGGFSMVIVLPERKSFGQFEAGLDAKKAQSIIAGLSHRKVALTMPKFKFEQEMGLKDTLSAMGMLIAFKWPDADFSGMDGMRGYLYISAVIHKAMIAVDEKGTEAAAATAVVMATKSMPMPEEPVEFTADHPFFFLIRDRETGSILFLGRVMNPKA